MILSPTCLLAQALVRRPSVTPADAGCQALLRQVLADAGFDCLDLPSGPVSNLLAVHGRGRPIMLLAGHTDVVPPGETQAWQDDPYAGSIRDCDGRPGLYGRGSADMKGGDAAMVRAAADFVRAHPRHAGTVMLAFTSNEEGDACGGMPHVIEHLRARALVPDYGLLAEASCREILGDCIKIGHRGDLNATLVISGRQGHVAQIPAADNAAHRAARFIHAMLCHPADRGTAAFEPTSFQVSSLQAAGGADNVVPGTCTLRCNWRYGTQQTPAALAAHVRAVASQAGVDCRVEAWREEGAPFLSAPGKLTAAAQTVIAELCGVHPTCATTGGTSDGRFFAPLGTEIIEFGPLNASIHQIDEHVALADLDTLTRVFARLLSRLCPSMPAP